MIEARWLVQCADEKGPGADSSAKYRALDGRICGRLNPRAAEPFGHVFSNPIRRDVARASAASLKPLRLAEVRSLEFEEPRYDVFPALNLARQAGEAGGVLPAILNAANEVAVQAFLDNQIPFPEIWRLVHSAMEYNANLARPSLDDIIRADSEARLFVRRAIVNP